MQCIAPRVPCVRRPLLRLSADDDFFADSCPRSKGFDKKLPAFVQELSPAPRISFGQRQPAPQSAFNNASSASNVAVGTSAGYSMTADALPVLQQVRAEVSDSSSDECSNGSDAEVAHTGKCAAHSKPCTKLPSVGGCVRAMLGDSGLSSKGFGK